jgi:hypothetical protein
LAPYPNPALTRMVAGLARPKKRPLPRPPGSPAPRAAAPPGFNPNPGYVPPPAPLAPPNWQDIIAADPDYKQSLADILADSVGDRAGVDAALRSALVRYGGAGALRGMLGQLGGIGQGWESLLDEATLGGAESADKSGTSLISQLDKAHRDKSLAEADIRAAKGLSQSSQSGYEIGEERQRDTIARSDALSQLLDFLREGIGGYAGRESQRNAARAAARRAAADRAVDLGLEPPAPPPPPPPPPTPPALVRQLVRNNRRPPRRPIGGWE